MNQLGIDEKKDGKPLSQKGTGKKIRNYSFNRIAFERRLCGYYEESAAG